MPLPPSDSSELTLHPFSLVLAAAHPALLWLTFFPSTDIVDKIIGMVPTYN